MLKTFKWIYNLGKKHERRRIELLIQEYRKDKPIQPTFASDEKDERSLELYDRQLAVWYEVSETLANLTNPFPYQGEITEYKRPIDD
jgi:hypothetical protein